MIHTHGVGGDHNLGSPPTQDIKGANRPYQELDDGEDDVAHYVNTVKIFPGLHPRKISKADLPFLTLNLCCEVKFLRMLFFMCDPLLSLGFAF